MEKQFYGQVDDNLLVVKNGIIETIMQGILQIKKILQDTLQNLTNSEWFALPR